MTPQEEVLAAVKPEWEKLTSDLAGKFKEQRDEINKLGVALPETKEAIAKMTVRTDEMEKLILKAVDDYAKNEEANKKMLATLEELQTKLNRPAKLFGKDGLETIERTPHYKAWTEYIRKGEIWLKQKNFQIQDGANQVEALKLLIEGDDTLGGYLAPPEFVQDIIKGIILISPARLDMRIRTTSARSVHMPKRTGTFAAVWANEVSTRTETTGLTYGREEIPVHEMSALVDISNADLEDSAFDLNAELQGEFSEQIAKAEGTAFVNGTGVGQPEGFMINTAVANDVTTSASALTYAGYVTLIHNLKSAYVQGAILVMNRKTIGATRALTDSYGRPIWMPFSDSGLSISNPPTIMNSPYREYPDMPDVGADTFPVAFGNFKRGYIILDRIDIAVQRDPYTQNTKSVVRYICRKRVGGQVILAEAIRKLKCHT